MNAQFDIPQQFLNEAIEKSLFKGELGEKVADRLADIYADVTTYNRTDAAKLLNIARSTLYEYENSNQIKFRPDGRISLSSLRDFQLSLEKKFDEDEDEDEIKRKPHAPKRRSLKK